jgi:uncharacterized membrane-anchored protein YhcB (DUF1043 family)|tara:strand:+ start:2362 stop:2556 length:195 start_codon:yes stop_codon:yes gene_type:complete
MEIIVSFIVGFVVGALVARNNIKKLNVLVDEAKELADKAEAELKELKADIKKKPARKPRATKKK